MTPHDLTLMIYNISLLPVIFFSVLFIILCFINLSIGDKEKTGFRKLKEMPFVSVQIPTFNDPVAERCVKKCMKFNYPRSKYEIIIADDSTNKDTQRLLKKYADENPGFIKYIHRENREGFKAGALKGAMKITKGEILVIFDADWIPDEDFIKEVVKPFSDPEVAIVQTRQGFYNQDTNIISRFAAYLLMIYHTVVMPINNKINCVFFCGTAGALRRSAFDEVGGWNLKSLTEDSDLAIKLLMKGYKTVYLEMETPSEVPVTFESFLKQQMRWCYGNVRAFLENASKIMFQRGLTFKQRLMITYITIGNIMAPLVITMTFFGFAGWFIGDPSLINLRDFIGLLLKLLLTAGFFFIGWLTLYRRKSLKEFHYFIFSAFALGLILAVANTVAFYKAATNKRLHWYCTVKDDNTKFI